MDTKTTHTDGESCGSVASAEEQRKRAPGLRGYSVELGAWCTNDMNMLSLLQGPGEFLTEEAIVGGLYFTSADMSGVAGWVYVGVAKVKFTPLPLDDIRDHQAEAIRAEIQKVRAEAQVKVEKLEDRFHQLLALPNANMAPVSVEIAEVEDDGIPF